MVMHFQGGESNCATWLPGEPPATWERQQLSDRRINIARWLDGTDGRSERQDPAD